MKEIQVAVAKALEWCGDDLPEKLRWKAGQRCFDMNCSHFAMPHSYHSAPHDIPLPPLTDELAMAIEYACAVRGYFIESCTYKGSPTIIRRIDVFTSDKPVTDTVRAPLREAIIYAVAALADKPNP